MRDQQEVYLGIGNIVFCDWDIKHFKGQIELHGLKIDIQSFVRNLALHGQANMHLKIELEPKDAPKNSQEDVDGSRALRALQEPSIAEPPGHMIIKINAGFVDGVLDGQAFINIFNSVQG